MSTDFKVTIQAILDKSGIAKDAADIQKLMDKYPAELDLKLKTAKTKSEIKEVSKAFANMFSAQGINIPEKQINSALNSFINKSYSLEKALSKSVEQINQLKQNKSIDLKLSGIEKEYQNLKSLGLVTDELKSDFEQLKNAKNAFDKSSGENIVANYAELNAQMERVANTQKIIKNGTDTQVTSTKQQLTFDSKRQKVLQDISTYLSTNTRLTSGNTQEAKELYNEFNRIQNAIKSLNINDANFGTQFTILNNELQTAKKKVKEFGLEGRSATEEFKNMFTKFKDWFGVSQIVMFGVQKLRNAADNLKEVNEILTEISKTSNATDKELEQIGKESYDRASKYGVKNTEYLTGVQEMNRSGFYGKQGKDMAELSIKTIKAGNVTDEIAQKYLLATNAAYGYKGSIEKLNAVLDGQNQITNRNSVDMETMATATEKSGSVAANAGIKINQLSAMIGTISARTKEEGTKTGTGLKSLIVNLQNLSSDKIVGTLNKANASMTETVDGIEKLRNPIDILKDLAKTYNSLDEKDPLKSEITTNIGQKYHANQLAALLTGWEDYEKMLKDYSEGMGSAEEEANKSANNITGSLAKLENQWNKTFYDLANDDLIINSIGGLTGLLNVINDITDALGGLGTVGVLGGGILGAKNLGGCI